MRGFVGEIEVSGWASRMKEKDKQNKLLAIQPLLPWCSLQRNDLHLIHPQYNHWIALMEIPLASMWSVDHETPIPSEREPSLLSSPFHSWQASSHTRSANHYRKYPSERIPPSTALGTFHHTFPQAASPLYTVIIILRNTYQCPFEEDLSCCHLSHLPFHIPYLNWAHRWPEQNTRHNRRKKTSNPSPQWFHFVSILQCTSKFRRNHSSSRESRSHPYQHADWIEKCSSILSAYQR